MSMAINTNVLALNSHRSLKNVGAKQSVHSARLSSGLKINSAADDAAGLAISEKMRAQIRGLDMASKNSQDAISLIQTAEGGMQEIDNMLQRVRELTNQSSNDTNELEDREKIQDEINQLVEEIDSMSERVEFNKKKVINGSFSAKGTSASGGTDADSKYGSMNMEDAIAAATKDITDAVGKSNLSGISDYFRSKTDASKTTDPSFILKTADIMKGIESLESGKVVTADVKKITDALDGLAKIVANGVSLDTAVAGTATFDELTYEQLTSADFKLKNKSDAADATVAAGTDLKGVISKEQFNALQDAYKGLKELDARNTALTTSTNNLKTASIMTTAKNPTQQLDKFKDVLDGLAEGGTAPIAAGYKNPISEEEKAKVLNAFEELAGISLDAPGMTNLKESDFNKIKNNMETILGAMDKIDNEAIKAGEASPFTTTLTSDVRKTVANLENYMTARFGEGSSGSNGDGKALHFQVGANSEQSMYLNIGSVKSDTLGIGNGKGKSSIDVMKATGADITKTLDTLDKALSYVTTERSKLGAAQNRLEYTIKSLDVSSENLSAAESRIRDTDMAKEMMKFTQANVLQQAATSMLAQANQAPQNVLKLLG